MLYVWSLFVRVSHWLLVAAFATAWLTHASMWYANMHVLAGYITGILLLGRIAWGLCVKGYCNFNKFPFRPWEGLRYAWASLTGQARRCIGHNPAGSVVIYSMLAVGLLTVLSGWLVLNNAYLPDALPDFSSMHAVLAWTWLALVVTHVSGVIVKSLLQRENLVASMVTGYKMRHLRSPHYHYPRPVLRAWVRMLIMFRKLRYPISSI
jgi:cytochrome b